MTSQDESVVSEGLASYLGKFFLTRISELKNKILKKNNISATIFDRNLIMVICYTIFHLSGTQIDLMIKWSTD